ncbi:hypothetical protein TNCV_1201971 [Trichonephila clavipes]|nr:hypothetical protein TNCV_1201971 [Trichonephila clavipes]
MASRGEKVMCVLKLLETEQKRFRREFNKPPSQRNNPFVNSPDEMCIRTVPVNPFAIVSASQQQRLAKVEQSSPYNTFATTKTQTKNYFGLFFFSGS